MQAYIKYLVLGIGILCSSISGCFLTRSWSEAQSPVPLDLAAMERGEEPPSRYVRLEDYVVRTEETFVRARITKGETKPKITDVFFPVVSKSSPAADLQAPLTAFVIVVSPRGSPLSSDGKLNTPVGPLQGALAIGVDAIEGDEITFLRKKFPGLDVSRIRVLIPGDKPWTGIYGWMWLVFGIITTLVGGMMLLGREEK